MFLLAYTVLTITVSSQDNTPPPLQWSNPSTTNNPETKELIEKFADKTPQGHDDPDFIQSIINYFFHPKDTDDNKENNP